MYVYIYIYIGVPKTIAANASETIQEIRSNQTHAIMKFADGTVLCVRQGCRIPLNGNSAARIMLWVNQLQGAMKNGETVNCNYANGTKLIKYCFLL